jgi:hypothetical protein
MNRMKYEKMQSAGAEPEEIVQAAKRDDLMGFEIVRLLRSLFGLSLKESGALVRKVGMEIYEERTRSPSAPTSKAHEFRRVFDATLEAAARAAEHFLGQPVPRNFVITLSGAARSDGPVDVDTAFDKLYLGDEEFFYLVEVIIKEFRAGDDYLRLWMLVSHHRPVSFEKTLNRPPGAGPFTIISARNSMHDIIAKTYLLSNQFKNGQTTLYP